MSSLRKLWSTVRKWRLWNWIWRGIELLVAVGVAGILWTECSDRGKESKHYHTLLSGTYTETLFNKIDAESAKQHFAQGVATLNRFSSDSAVGLLNHQRTPNEIRVHLQIYIREMRAKNAGLDAASALFQRTCSLRARDAERITTLLSQAVMLSSTLILLLAPELKGNGWDIPVAEGPRDGSTASVSYCK